MFAERCNNKNFTTTFTTPSETNTQHFYNTFTNIGNTFFFLQKWTNTIHNFTQLYNTLQQTSHNSTKPYTTLHAIYITLHKSTKLDNTSRNFITHHKLYTTIQNYSTYLHNCTTFDIIQIKSLGHIAKLYITLHNFAQTYKTLYNLYKTVYNTSQNCTPLQHCYNTLHNFTNLYNTVHNCIHVYNLTTFYKTIHNSTKSAHFQTCANTYYKLHNSTTFFQKKKQHSTQLYTTLQLSQHCTTLYKALRSSTHLYQPLHSSTQS